MVIEDGGTYSTSVDQNELFISGVGVSVDNSLFLSSSPLQKMIVLCVVDDASILTLSAF